MYKTLIALCWENALNPKFLDEKFQFWMFPESNYNSLKVGQQFCLIGQEQPAKTLPTFKNPHINS